MQQSAIAARLHNPDYVNCLPQCEFDRPASESASSGRLATLNSLQGPTRSRPVREFRTSGVRCVGMSSDFNLSHQILSVSSLTAGSPKESPALAAQLRAFSVISSSLRADLSTSRNHYVGKVSAFADELINCSHPLTVCQRYCGRRRLLTSPSTSAMSVRERLVHPRFTGLAAREARLATPYGQDRHGFHSAYAPLRPHQTCRRKEVRLCLVSFDARIILSGSVVHFVPDTSSGGERRRETVTAGVPLLCTPSLTDSQSGIATLALRSIYAGPIRSRGFSSSVAAAGFPQSMPSL